MTLIKCDECKKSISDKAAHCVHCGAPIPPNYGGNEESEGASEIQLRTGDSDKLLIGHISSYSNDTDCGMLLDARSRKKHSFSAKNILNGANPGLLVGTRVPYRILGSGEIEIHPERPQSPKAKTSSIKIPTSDSDHAASISRRYLGSVILGVLLFVYWIAKGMPAPGLFFAGQHAKDECLRLANENKGSALVLDTEITANATWIKDGKRVVQLLQEDAGNVRQIMCIYGNDMVSIPSILEQARWQY